MVAGEGLEPLICIIAYIRAYWCIVLETLIFQGFGGEFAVILNDLKERLYESGKAHNWRKGILKNSKSAGANCSGFLLLHLKTKKVILYLTSVRPILNIQ